MIRVYLDWNIISNFKKDEFLPFREFVARYKDIIEFPFSPAHFNDLMKSYRADNEMFKIDLDNLEYLSEKHFIRWLNNKMEVLSCSPTQYFEDVKDIDFDYSSFDFEKVFTDLDNSDIGLGKMGSLLISMFQSIPFGIVVNEENQGILRNMFPNITNKSTMWDLIKDFGPFTSKLIQEKETYKDLRRTVSNGGLKLDENSGNWNTEDVIRNVDSYLKNLAPTLTFKEFIETTFKNRNKTADKYEYYTTAYLLLDMIGYKADKLPKPTDNMRNVQTDGEHSFYSAHCDYFVVLDKKLASKTKVLFNEFNISTIVIKPQDFVEELEKVIHNIDAKTDFVEDLSSIMENVEVVDEYTTEVEESCVVTSMKLPIFYFNYFNYLVLQYYPEQSGYILTFKKVSKNYSNFIFFNEIEKLIDNVVAILGYNDEQDLIAKKNLFTHSKDEVELIWGFENGIIRLEKDIETFRPILSIAFKKK